MGKRILVVEDSFGDRMVLRDYLVSFGYSIVGEAKNIDESLEKYRKLQPDLVLMDAAIPDSDAVSGMMKLFRVDPDVNVLVCVSRGQRMLAMEAIAAGAKDFVTKPFNPRSLHKALKSVMG